MRIALVIALVVGGATTARAQPALTLPAGHASGTLTVEVNASEGAFAAPVSIAPDLSYGITDDLTVAVVHSTFATIGFRGNAGRGLCVTGEEDGCPGGVYDNVGAEVLYSLRRGPFAAAADVGYHAWSIDADHHAVKLGLKLRLRHERLTFASAPSVFVAVTARDDAERPQPDRLYLPLTGAYAFTPALSAGLGTGVKGPLDGFGDAYEIALGAFATYAIAPSTTVGASWVHGKILGGDAAVPPGTSGVDFRAAHVWLTFTR
jgi:hypothetical protein